MLNELYALHRNLLLRGIHTQAWHPWMQSFKKGDALVAEIGSEGQVARVSFLHAGEIEGLRNIVPNNQKSFPGFNLHCPLIQLGDLARWNDGERQWQAAQLWGGEISTAYQPDDLRRVLRLLREFPQREIAPRLGNGGPRLRSLMALVERLSHGQQTAEQFLHDLAVKSVAAVEAGRMSRDFALSVLFGKRNRKKRSLDAWKVTLILEVADLEHFPYRIADPSVGYECSAALLATEQALCPRPEVANFTCGLTGQPDVAVGGKLPNPNLPILGQTYLMSMNAESPCQTRYRRTSTNIFPAGRNTIRALNNSLLFITAESRRNVTWAPIPNAVKNTSDLLIAYLEEAPDAPVPIASLFTDADCGSAQRLATFERRVEVVYQALRVRNKVAGDATIRVMALRTLDLGRKQVIFQASYSAAAIFEAQRTWIAGSRNVPEIIVPFPNRKSKPIAWRKNHVPSPSEVMRSFKLQWVHSGETQRTTPGVELRRVYELLLHTDAKLQARWLLDRYVPLTMPLLIGLARALRGGPRLSEAARENALTVIATYGILLFRQGRVREAYMQSREYLLGQFLQYADLLHKLYCESERDNSLPSQLIGNAVLPMATQSPVRAFDVLSQRMPVFLAWAERSTGDKAGLAKWTKKELGRIAGLLKRQDLSPAVRSAGKAELLLGYLAKSVPGRRRRNESFNRPTHH